ncbi:hypothetical protein OAS47_04140 [Pelagibacteraceae bacterium]|nr:hypothetical protein [Pelagibacteraceae bacterium]
MNKKIFFFCIIVFLARPGNVFSKIDIFDVDNVQINNNKVENKEELLSLAFKKGFEQLIKKILKSEDIEAVSKTPLREIRSLLSYYQITNNAESLRENKTIVNLSFSREKMNSFFEKRNISYADISNQKIIIFPVEIKDQNFLLFSDSFFYTNWNITSPKVEYEFLDFILPTENLDDIIYIKNNLTQLERIDVFKLLSKYDIDEYIFLVINETKINFNIFLKGTLSKKNFTKNFTIKVNNENKKQKNEIINFLKNEINDIWKSNNLIDIRTPSFLNIVLDINKKDDLLNLQKALDNIDLIENYHVVQLNMHSAKIKIKYYGKIDKIKNKFNEQKIKVNVKNNEWKLKII